MRWLHPLFFVEGTHPLLRHSVLVRFHERWQAQSALFAEDILWVVRCTRWSSTRYCGFSFLVPFKNPKFERFFGMQQAAGGELTALCILHAARAGGWIQVREDPSARREGPTRYAGSSGVRIC